MRRGHTTASGHRSSREHPQHKTGITKESEIACQCRPSFVRREGVNNTRRALAWYMNCTVSQNLRQSEWSDRPSSCVKREM